MDNSCSLNNCGSSATTLDRLRPRLTRMAQFYARNTGEDADDLLQEGWAGLLEALRDNTSETTSAYLLSRARWRILDNVRRSRIRRCLPLAAFETELKSREALLDETSVALFVDLLKPSQREVLACLLDGLTWREAGARLGCSSANIAYHVGQIRRKYAEYMDLESSSAS